MNLYFIAGASGSGKTAIIPHLKELWGKRIAVYDFDEIGVPKDADTKWRQEFTEKWLQKLLSDNQDACLLGQMVLGEIFSCPSATQLSKINFCFLDVSDIERIKRLRKRGTYGADQNMLSWAAWLRMHLFDPHWHLQAIKENSWSALNWSALDDLSSWTQKANIKIIDTSKDDVAKTAKKIAGWVRSRLK
jgi:hypothetical protein